MIFLDNIDFIGLLGLVSQAAMAWLMVAFFRVAASPSRPWVGMLQAAFLSLAVGLSAIAIRFVLPFRQEVFPWLTESSVAARASYAIYLAGKASFLWFLLGALANLRDRSWPPAGRLFGAVVAVAALLGALAGRIDLVMAIQAPAVVLASVFAVMLLGPTRPGRTDVGHWVVAGVMGLHAIVWTAYFVAALAIRFGSQDEPNAWNLLLRSNSAIDFGLQVALGIGLVVMMMDGVHQSTVAALLERDALRERMRRTEKMQALNTLVGGVAHEINNPLTAILGFAEDLMLSDPAARAEAARVVREQAERCRAIVQRLSILGEAREPQRERVDVRAIVDRVVRGIEPQRQAVGARIVTEIDGRCATISVEVAAMEQVLTNLLVNALHASRRGDRIVVTATATDRRVTFAVEDAGPGVADADRERIFEPFFSTKRAGEGTGLGLAVARALVTAHDGEIHVEAGARGARFVVTLPQSETPADAAPEPAAQTVESRRAPPGARLLIIDDEPLVRTTIARHAERDGWQIEEAGSVQEALPHLVGAAEPVDFVVCDLRLPGRSGADLYDYLAAEAPEWIERIVFVTGDLASADAAAFARRCKAPIFTKPLDFGELFLSLRHSLVSRHPTTRNGALEPDRTA